MIYAPVIIPTLCRYEHFKACLESLSLCNGAEYTDVFIGLDYPAKDSHWDGYNKIKKYLNETKFPFKSLNIIERDRNYGLGPNGNYRSLLKDVLKKYDRYIFSEDDNVFSPNFLEFINKGLEKFENDKSVFAINGYRHDYPIKSDENTFFRQNVNYSAWGEGLWRDRLLDLPPLDYFKKRFTLKEFFKVKKEIGANRAFDYWQFFFHPQTTWHDSSWAVFAYLENMDVIMPSKQSLVRNMGWDSSGVHCAASQKLNSKFQNQKISSEKEFDYVGTGMEYYLENRNVMKTYSYAKVSELVFWRRFLKNIVKYTIGKFLKT